MIDPEAR